MRLRKVGIVGTGSYVPEGRLTNADLEKLVDTTDEWIMQRTGIAERRRCRPDQASSDLGYEACVRALEDAGITADQIDVLICATISPDMNFPSTACFIQKKLKCLNTGCYDISAACSGFMFALQNGRALVASGAADSVLCVGAECMTKITNYEDRTSCILFGDAAGAVVLRPTDGPHELIDTFARSDGHDPTAMSMVLRCGGTRSPFCQRALDNKEHLQVIHGRQVYRFAVQKMEEVIRDTAARLGIAVSDIDLVVPHQANLRIIEAVAERLDLPIERFYINIQKYGNSSAASVPLALDEAVREGRIKSGDLVMMATFGAGLTWGSATVRW